MTDEQMFDTYLEEINTLIHNELIENIEKDSNIYNALSYAINAGGKRIRPILFALVLEAYGYDFHKYAKAISAIEMVHTYSLVHDDLPAMDNDDLRRGKPTVHKQFDEATAILAGDALLTDAFYLLTLMDVDDSTKIMLIRILSAAAGSKGMIYGQDLDIANDAKEKLSVKEIEQTYYYKTCLMIEAALAMAAIITKNDITPFIKIGTSLGQAFQIQDDILEYTQTTKQLGKSNQSDLKNKKQTITSKIGLDRSNLMVQNYFDNIELIINELGLYGSKLHLFIVSIASRKM